MNPTAEEIKEFKRIRHYFLNDSSATASNQSRHSEQLNKLAAKHGMENNEYYQRMIDLIKNKG